MIRNALLTLIVLSVAPGCVQSFLYGNLWQNISVNATWNSTDETTPVCSTTTSIVELLNDGTYVWTNRYNEVKDDANCGQPETYTSSTEESGTHTIYTQDNDKQTWIHFRRTHQTETYAYGSEDPMSTENGDSSEWSTPFSNGRDDLGLFLIFGDGWSNSSIFRKVEN